MTTAEAECEALFGAALGLAEHMLAKHGGFHPFGFVMKNTGEITAIAADDADERPRSASLIDLLKDGFRQGARHGEYKATALAYDVRITLPGAEEKSDAIAVALDHGDDYSVLVVVPYAVDEGQVIFGQALAQKGEGDIFRQD